MTPRRPTGLVGCQTEVSTKNWRELYFAALVEIDAAALKRRAELALQAVQQRIRELKNISAAPGSEPQSLRDAASALHSLLRST